MFRHHLNLKLLLINGELAGCSELQIFSSDDESIESRHTIINPFWVLTLECQCALQDKEAAVVEDCLSLYRATKNKLLLKSVRALQHKSGLNRNSCD